MEISCRGWERVPDDGSGTLSFLTTESARVFWIFALDIVTQIFNFPLVASVLHIVFLVVGGSPIILYTIYIYIPPSFYIYKMIYTTK